MIKMWDDEAWEDYLYWQTQNRKTLKRINLLMQDIDRNGYLDIGKPEPLKGNIKGYWSRRIDEVNRLVYRINGSKIEIIQCRKRFYAFYSHITEHSLNRTVILPAYIMLLLLNPNYSLIDKRAELSSVHQRIRIFRKVLLG